MHDPDEAEIALIRAAAGATLEPRVWSYAWPVLVICGELFVVDYQTGSATSWQIWRDFADYVDLAISVGGRSE